MSKSTSNQDEGSDALIHLRVPAALKARWVRDSRQEGAKLTDWIVRKVEARMNVFKVPEALASKYHGAGYALAATLNGVLVDIVYLEDVLPGFDAGSYAGGRLDAEMLSDGRLGPSVRHLQALGEVHVGMLSSWEFVEL